MSTKSPDKLRIRVRERFGKIAQEGGGCGCAPGCCGPTAHSIERIGYAREHLADAPAGADMGLGCGNPQAIAAMRPGETVLDLGCGGGLDCFLSGKQVGPTGRVTGIDMTPEMVTKARANARNGCIAGAASVETTQDLLRWAGFEDVRIDVNPASRDFIRDWLPGSGAEQFVASANITARPKRD